MWEVEPDSDAATAASDERIIAHLLDRARSGSIVILHVMYPGRGESLAAVPGVIAGLRDRRYRFVTVSELLVARASDEATRRPGRPIRNRQPFAEG